MDPRTIRLGFEGIDRLEVNADGDLVLHVGDAAVRIAVRRDPDFFPCRPGVGVSVQIFEPTGVVTDTLPPGRGRAGVVLESIVTRLGSCSPTLCADAANDYHSHAY